MKRCAWCKKKKSVKEFRKHYGKAVKKYGKYYRICKACSKEHGEVNRKRYPMLAEGYGWCATCHKWKTVGEFHKSSWNTTGLTNQCIRCISDNPDKLDRRVAREEMFAKGFKWCAPCAEWKKLEEFSKNKCKRDGLSTVCKQCFNAINDDYHRRNIDKIRKRTKSRYCANRDFYAEKNAKYVRENRGKVSARVHRRRARIKGMSGSFTDSQWKLLMAHYSPRNECLMCKRTDRKLTRDHVNPTGTNYISNIQPLCGPCNTAKMRRHIELRPDFGLYAKSLMKLNK